MTLVVLKVDEMGSSNFFKIMYRLQKHIFLSIFILNRYLVQQALLALMQADLEFEYPHKLERLLVRSEILEWLDEEEKKLKSIAQ